MHTNTGIEPAHRGLHLQFCYAEVGFVCVCFAGLFSSTFWEQGFDKVRESSRTLELFEQFDVQFQKWRICLFSWS